MLEKLEDMVLTKTVKDIINSIDNRDFEQIKLKAHQLKGASSYIGAGRLYYVCYYI